MSSNYTLNRTRCIGCTSNKYTVSKDISQKIIKLASLNQIITKNIGQSGSQYLGNLGSLEVWRDSSCSQIGSTQQTNKASQASDRYYKAQVPKTSIIPTRGNSIKRTQTILRPGALGSGGSGVDVKHNSYARYLAKKKGGVILGEKIPDSIKNSKQIVNNKFMKGRVVAGGLEC